ncbi:hypothetical protein JYT92_00070 [bacterium AH-315-L15]|nr:hypothetical protein [bacterium AH-315-L15]
MKSCLNRVGFRFDRIFGFLLVFSLVGFMSVFLSATHAVDRDATQIEVLGHAWQAGEVWERIGKTKFLWNATVRNHSDLRKRVYLYYDLLDAREVPLARNVTNKYVGPHETVKIVADSYIMTVDLPRVKNSRVTVKVGVPN